jgi:hypothetical protein
VAAAEATERLRAGTLAPYMDAFAPVIERVRAIADG